MNLSIIAGALAVGVVAVCAACSNPQQQQAATTVAASVAAAGTPQVLSSVNVDRLIGLCQIVQPLAQGASASSQAAVKTVGQFGSAYCGQLLAGALPATTNGNTENWLLGLIGSLRG